MSITSMTSLVKTKFFHFNHDALCAWSKTENTETSLKYSLAFILGFGDMHWHSMSQTLQKKLSEYDQVLKEQNERWAVLRTAWNISKGGAPFPSLS